MLPKLLTYSAKWAGSGLNPAVNSALCQLVRKHCGGLGLAQLIIEQNINVRAVAFVICRHKGRQLTALERTGKNGYCKDGPSDCIKLEIDEVEEYSLGLEYSTMQIAKQARNERGQKLFQIFRQEENEVYIASLAR